MEFGIGVPSNLNNTTPLDYPISHPLGTDTQYYEDWDSYIFAKIEGIYDIDENGFDGEDILFAFHAGMDRVYQEIALNHPITLREGEVMDINFELDVKQLFTLQPGDLFYLEPYNPEENIPENIVIMHNLSLIHI